jgi:hypothetical protein
MNGSTNTGNARKESAQRTAAFPHERQHASLDPTILTTDNTDDTDTNQNSGLGLAGFHPRYLCNPWFNRFVDLSFGGGFYGAKPSVAE